MAINQTNPGRFSSSAQAFKYTQDRTALAAMSVQRPPPPDAYRDLAIGPRTAIEIVPNEAYPVDGSNALLRTLSPFIIQVEIPLVFGQDGGFSNQASNSVNINTFANANSVMDLYANARSSVARSKLNSNGRMGIQTRPNPPADATNKGADGDTVTKTGMGGGSLGLPAIADQNVAMDIAKQLITALNAPPLVLLINPRQMALTLTKVQSYQDRNRYGYIFHTWGEEQPKLSISARCGAFISGGRGVQFASKNDSAAWQNLMNAFRFFKHNGYLHDTVGKSNAHHHVGALSITYDGWIYYGHMESFSWNFEEVSANGGIEFAMEFTVSRAVDTAAPTYVVVPMSSPIPSLSDPRYAGVRINDGPGVYTIGKDGVTSLGQDVGGQGFFTMVPDDLGDVFTKGQFDQKSSTALSTPDQPLGTGGFYMDGTGSSREIQQSDPGSQPLFRLG